MRTDSSIPEFVSEAINHGNQLIAARKRGDADNAARRHAEELAKIAAEWRPVLATIHQAVPTWAHPYIVTPTDKPTVMDCRVRHVYDTYRLPAVIDLSALLADVPAIRVWAKPHDQNPMICFEAGRYSLVHDDEIGQWFVMTRFDNYEAIDNDLHYFQPDSPGATDDLHVALAQAVADRTDLAALLAEADRLNALPAAAAAAVAAVAEPVEAIDPLTRIADTLERFTALYEQHLSF